MIHSHQTTFGRLGRVALVFVLCFLLVLLNVSLALAAGPEHGTGKNSKNPKGAGRASKVKSAVTVPTTFDIIQLTNDTVDEQGQPTVAVDNSGNVHVVYIDSNVNADELYYKMFKPDGTVLIDSTLITADDSNWSNRPFIATDSQGNVHVVWKDWRNPWARCYYMKLDPYLDDLNGTSADLATIQTVSDKMVSQDTSADRELYPRIAIDKDDNLHLVYTDYSTNEAWYRKLDNNGDGLTGFVDVGTNDGYHGGNGIDVDSNGDVHIITADGNSWTYYSMIDGATGNILIDQTAINDVPGG